MDEFNVIAIFIAFCVALAIGADAKARGMSGLGWGVFTFLLCVIAIPIYLIVRKPRIDSD